MENQESENRLFNESDVELSTAKSGGPGGQNVNKRETAVEARIPVKKLRLDSEERKFVRENFTPGNQYVEDEDSVFVVRSGIKSQAQARKSALEGLRESIEEALEAGRRERDAKKHQERARKRQRKGGGSKKEGTDKREAETKRGRSWGKEEWLERAFEEDPDLEKRFEKDNGETEQSSD